MERKTAEEKQDMQQTSISSNGKYDCGRAFLKYSGIIRRVAVNHHFTEREVSHEGMVRGKGS